MNYTLPKNRILSLDILRGIAVLGIFIMNIQNFSMPIAAYSNPTAYGDLTGINKFVWILSYILANTKFMSIFSILFGAGIILFIENARSKNLNTCIMHYRRNALLLFFGLIHAYLIWSGDILVTYSLCAFFVYLFRNKTPKTLFIIGGIFLFIPVCLSLLSGLSISLWPRENYLESLKSWQPTMELINQEITSINGTWIEVFSKRASTSIFMQTFLLLFMTFWRISSMMFLGMGLYKLGILSAKMSKVFYKKMLLICLLLGLSITLFGLIQNFQHEWKMDYSMFIGNQYNYIGSLPLALAYISIVMLISKSDGLKSFKNSMAKVGRMAFSNYILMSLIGVALFSGSGFALYGSVERGVQLLIVFAVWFILILFSNIWLKKHKLGPLEWLWRSLTYFTS